MHCDTTTTTTDGVTTCADETFEILNSEFDGNEINYNYIWIDDEDPLLNNMHF